MDDHKTIRVRFAPSPTGDLHIGGLRVAIFNWLFARQRGGTFVLRIEDTDQKRFQPESVKSILEGLSWAGLDWDEGPIFEKSQTRLPMPVNSQKTLPDLSANFRQRDVSQGKGYGGQVPNPKSQTNTEIQNSKFQILDKGGYGPYFQSQRTELYRKHVDILLEKGSAYRCFCTAERLEQMRKDQEARKMPPMYDKNCLKLAAQEVESKLNNHMPHVIRMNVPAEGKLEIKDIIKGAVSFDLSLVDDQVLLKSDGYPTYHLANVVDDHLMAISHVLRGEDWLPSLPKHILLYKAFGWEQPQFGHLPLILAADKTKLSKRHGAVSVLAFKESGYLPDALLNFTLLLGWNPGKGSEQELFTKEDMLKQFSLDGIQKSPAIFNYEKLNWMNSQYIKKLSLHTLTDLVLPQLLESGSLVSMEGGEWMTADRRTVTRSYVERTAALAQPRLVFLKDIVQESEIFFIELLYDPSLLQWKETELDAARANLIAVKEYVAHIDEADFSAQILETRVKAWIQEQTIGVGDVLWPLRVALTGRAKSPSPFEVMEVLGREESVKRIDAAIEKLS